MSEFRALFSRIEVLEYVSTISIYNRIQGSSDLEEVANYIYRELKNIPNGTVSMHIYDYNRTYGCLGPLAGWDVKYGEVTMISPEKRVLATYYNARTTVCAHSPPGDVEGSVVFIGRGLDIDKYKDLISDKIVLSYGPPSLVYFRVQDLGAKAVVFYRRTGPEEAVPYTGLHLSPDEARNAKIPAVTIPRREALRILNKLERGEDVKLRVVVESSYRAEARIPVIELRMGDGEEEIHIVAHICHPGGTVNDNVSGTATVIEIAKMLDRALDRELITKTRHTVRFVLFPEYYGSQAFIENLKGIATNTLFTINLDMVGEQQEITKSTLQLIRTPLAYYSPYEALLYAELVTELSHSTTFATQRKILSYRFDLVPYESGSDHDVYLHHGIPSIMINQWPDRFYHTHLDSIDKFDPGIVESIATAILKTLYRVSILDKQDLDRLSKRYLDYVIDYELLRTYEVALERENAIGKYFEIISKEKKEEKGDIVYRGPRSIITLSYVRRKLGLERAIELHNIFETKKYLSTLIMSYIPMMLRKTAMSKDELKTIVFAEYGLKIHDEDLDKAIKLYKDLDFV